MPIRPENRSRYPSDWPAVSLAIREAAGHRCQRCNVRDREMILRGKAADGHPLWRPMSASAYENGFSAETGDEVSDTSIDTVDWGPPFIAVLTVAHLDHTPENCAPENLRAWCQRCHNAYDAPMRVAGIQRRRRAAKAISDLFAGGEK